MSLGGGGGGGGGGDSGDDGGFTGEEPLSGGGAIVKPPGDLYIYQIPETHPYEEIMRSLFNKQNQKIKQRDNAGYRAKLMRIANGAF